MSRRCPHCGHDPKKPSGQSGFMAMTTAGSTDWRLVAWTALAIVAFILVLAGVHQGVIGHD